jgi:hypothetical protein
MADLSTPFSTDQQNSTALKWSSNGELSTLDLQRIVDLLTRVDPVAQALMAGRLDNAAVLPGSLRE